MQTTEGLVCDICGNVYGCGASHQACPWCEVERLRAIIVRLAQFADGTVALPGDDAWFPGENQAGIVQYNNPWRAGTDEWGAETAECYSTQDAAKAAGGNNE